MAQNERFINIEPVDVDVRIRANGIKIWNGFKHKGFTKRSAFINVVKDVDPTFKDFEREKELERFWAGRFWSQFLNDDLEKVLDKISAE